MKLGVKLTTGFLLVAFLVGFVGIFGIVSNNTIQKNNKIEREVTELINLLDHLLVQVLQLIETQNLDEYRDIKSSSETARKDFDVLHERNEESFHHIEKFGGLDKDVEEITKISNGIIAIHKEKLVQEREFTQKVILERDLRRKIRIPIFALRDATLTEDIGSLQYKSKEALYQYRDQKHVDEWLETISIVKNKVGNSQLVQDFVSYELLAQGLGEIVIEQQGIEAQELVKIGQLGRIINTFRENEKIIVQNIRSENESVTRNARWTLLTVILAAFFAAIALGVYISRSIAKPVGSVSQTAQAIASGDLSKRVEVKSKDEIGQLATAFNEMADKLKESHEGLEEKVRIRTDELREEKDKAVTILQGIGDGVFAVDTNHRITIFNQAAVALSGFTTEEALGQKYDTILRFVLEEDEKSRDAFIHESLEAGEARKMRGPMLLIGKNGRKIAVASSAAPLKDKDGNVVSSVVVFRDVTKEREIDRAKSEFVSLASHQLRTPLSTVNWYAEMLLGDVTKRSKEVQRRYLEKIYHNNQRMARLVSALLNASRIELGTLTIQLESVDLTAIADAALDELSPEIKKKALQLEKHYDKNLPIISADPELTRTIFQTVLSNAVKYTPDGGEITFTIQEKKPDVVITVSDKGCGIPESQQAKIFTKLFRADNARIIDTDGTGLGLYIVKAIVELGHGKIWFESKENKGSTFYVTIPLEGMKPEKAADELESS